MEAIPSMFGGIRQATTSLIDDPPCPLFPDASVFLSRMMDNLWYILDWMGAPAGILSSIVAKLSFRAYQVAWARASQEQRLNTLMIGAIVAPVGLIAIDPKRFEDLLKKVEAAPAETA